MILEIRRAVNNLIRGLPGNAVLSRLDHAFRDFHRRLCADRDERQNHEVSELPIWEICTSGKSRRQYVCENSRVLRIAVPGRHHNIKNPAQICSHSVQRPDKMRLSFSLLASADIGPFGSMGKIWQN